MGQSFRAGGPGRTFRAGDEIAAAGEVPDAVLRIESGWVARIRTLPDGRRQITALYLPGDLCEPHWALGSPPLQCVRALTPVQATAIAPVPDQALAGGRLLMAAMAQLFERQSEAIVSLGRRTASERLAHLLYGIYLRLAQSGQCYSRQCALPLTQTDLGDLAGLTAVHTNRILQALRARGLIDLRDRWLRIPDPAALRAAAAWSDDPARPEAPAAAGPTTGAGGGAKAI